ncbi:hypothetical protein [Asanoa iriomotensis]|uniref:Uncharacterized protein n=1 Tax=Asanoa iriomotensis TaxID=234613 RepID=A0ABQ4C1B3_9ACTN|nr:hypothetical protein [Asanoa iriomotensis]GIF56572.1 hypothetical protein Air01nite_26670 [Asanoa iriomotensis]
MTLAERLGEWTDWDGAQYELGRALGLFEGRAFAETKGVFWTDNALGNGLHETLLVLVQAGVLDRREEPDEQFRWRATSE